MNRKERDAQQMAIKRRDFLDKGFELFARKSIDSVTLQEVAESAGYGIATMYRYFKTKQDFVIAVGTWKWEQFSEENQKNLRENAFEGRRAADVFAFFLESFIELYQNHKDLLRFNQSFNIYLQAENIGTDRIKPYNEVVKRLQERFHEMYLDAQKDHSLRTDVTETEMFSASLHLMLAAVTRYAVGLVFDAGIAPEQELRLLKEMLMKEYVIGE